MIINCIKYNDETINYPIQLNIQRIEDITLLIKLEKDVIEHIPPSNINLDSWDLEIVYYLKNGEIVEKKYSKAGNDAMFKPLLDSLY